MSEQTCQICTVTGRQLIACKACKETACTECCKKWILGDKKMASCMFCKEDWDVAFMTSVFDHKFLWGPSKYVTYKDHMESVYYAEQVAKLPATQLEIAKIVEIEKDQEHIKTLKTQLAELRVEIIRAENALSRKKRMLDPNYNPREHPEDVAAQMAFEAEKLNEINEKKSKEPLIMCPCPQPNCPGFVLGASRKCGMCETKVCGRCWEPQITNEHECDPEIYATVTEIKASSKKCPNCKVQIYKSQGCNHMFCTACKTKFDWGTLKILASKFFHNPEYADWLARTERSGTACTDILHIAARDFGTTSGLYRLCQLIIEIQNWADNAEPRLRPEELEPKLKDLRVKHLRSQLDKDDFKAAVQKYYKKVSKEKEILDIRRTFANVSEIILQNYLGDPNRQGRRFGPVEMLDPVKKDLERIYNDAIDALKSLSKRYKCKEPNVHFVNTFLERYVRLFDTISYNGNAA
jgi:hypothetical protein